MLRPHENDPHLALILDHLSRSTGRPGIQTEPSSVKDPKTAKLVFAALYAVLPVVQSPLLRMVIYKTLASRFARPWLPDIILWLKEEPVEPHATSLAESVFESDREGMDSNIQSFCKSESIAWDTALSLSRCIEQTRNKRFWLRLRKFFKKDVDVVVVRFWPVWSRPEKIRIGFSTNSEENLFCREMPGSL